ncbi:OmpA family protein, partial [Stenotrophomonas sp. ATCM1_4]|uniref:DUF7507 domain-containing protein n=1 Tax=Stenotrophomonas sp. ATCM1_4 TaxID=2259330 RepID=UPI001045C5C8
TVVTPVATLSQTLTKALTSNADGDASGTVSLGDVLTYTVTVTNTSASGNLTDVVVSDSRITPSTITCASVAPGATCVLTGTYTVTAADVTAGSISNTATATSPACPAGSTDPACTTTVVTPVAMPTVIYSKSTNAPGPVKVGDTISYTLTAVVSNSQTTGVVALNDTLGPGLTFDSVIDAGAYTCTASSPLVCTLPTGTLPGSYTITYTATVNGQASGTVTNTVVGAGQDAPGCTMSCSTSTPVTSIIDAINDVPNPVRIDAGGVTPSVLVNDTLNGNPVMPGAVTLEPGTRPSPGLTMNPDGTITVAPGTPSGTYLYPYTICDTVDPTNCDTATATVEVIGQALLRLVKAAGVRDARIGDLVRYTVTAENVGDADLNNGYIVDAAPAGFTYVEGSLSVVDGDNAGTVSGQSPLRFNGLDIRAGKTATLVYLMRVGAGVRQGTHINQAQGYSPVDQTISNVATAEVMLVADALVDDSLIAGTVFDDRDGDGWQDSAALSEVRVQGGFSPSAYVPNSTTVDWGNGPQPMPDASSPMLHGLVVGAISGRQSVADPESAHQVVIRQKLRSLNFTDDFVLTNAQGVTVRMSQGGDVTVQVDGEAEKGLNAAAPKVERKVAKGDGGYVVDYVITNAGIDERGVPGVRIASAEGLLIETDQFGRYHLPDAFGGARRGRNFILKVDSSTLPAGAEFTTDNPLLRRLVPGLPVRFDFGVKLPVEQIEGVVEQIELEMGEVLFAPGSSVLRADYLPAVDRMASKVAQYHGGEVVITANGETDVLAFDRAVAMKTALIGKLDAESAKALKVSVRTVVDDPGSLLVGMEDGGASLGTVLFDTDTSAIRPEFEPLLDKVAVTLEKMGGGQIGVVGHTDVRASHEYNAALGLRRSTAVYEALAKRLSPEVRAKVRVEVSADPTAAVGAKRK